MSKLLITQSEQPSARKSDPPCVTRIRVFAPSPITVSPLAVLCSVRHTSLRAGRLTCYAPAGINTILPPPAADAASIAFCIDAVSSAIPSPFAPYSRTLNVPAHAADPIARIHVMAPSNRAVLCWFFKIIFFFHLRRLTEGDCYRALWRCLGRRPPVVGSKRRGRQPEAVVKGAPIPAYFWSTEAPALRMASAMASGLTFHTARS